MTTSTPSNSAPGSAPQALGRRQPVKAALARAAAVGVMCLTVNAATVTVGPWVPIYQGVELTSGQQVPQTGTEKTHQVLCLRVDLTAAGIELFTTPHCTNCTLETTADFTSDFLQQNRLQVAVNGAFYSSSSGPSDSPLGTAEDVYGLAISRGVQVSSANNATYAATLLFTTNNQAFFVPVNNPGTNTAGIYTAVSGNYSLLINGVNVGAANANDLDPRTALGLSADRRYLFLMTIDGRQTGWSDGADFYNTGEWLKRFGASDGINVDGGGSTTMVMADCQGGAVRLNRSSFVAAYGRERNNGHNFGVIARPLPSDLKGLTVEPGATTATITWRTEAEGSTQVQYGLSTNLGLATTLDSWPVRQHVATLSGLTQGSNYYFRAISTVGGQSLEQACQFSTLANKVSTQVFGLTKNWTYTTNNLSGTSWTARTYDDSGWMGQGPGLLYVENNAAVAPKGTALPPAFGQSIASTYYFRTHFTFSGNTSGMSLILSNYVDDGAVFYLNGTEIYRLRMPAAPTSILYNTAATGVPCSGTAQAGDALPTCPDVFTLSGAMLTNLLQGDNVLAVEVHNYGSPTDVVFGSALILSTPVEIVPELHLLTEASRSTMFWNGEGFTLQQAQALGSSAAWQDVPGPITQSPWPFTNAATTFYRLRK
jgi:exopolysaccharide biosynthesis protein